MRTAARCAPPRPPMRRTRGFPQRHSAAPKRASHLVQKVPAGRRATYPSPARLPAGILVTIPRRRVTCPLGGSMNEQQQHRVCRPRVPCADPHRTALIRARPHARGAGHALPLAAILSLALLLVTPIARAQDEDAPRP